MKRIYLIIVLLGFTQMAQAQTASVEKSIYGLQLGIQGIYVYNESRLAPTIAMRSELGVELGYYSNSFLGVEGFLIAPALSLEPRWYHNLKRRKRKSKRIDGNSGNFIALRSTYHAGELGISTDDNVKVASDITIVPTYGIRRNIGQHFNYEMGLGIGYLHVIEESYYILNESDVAVNLHVRIGYSF